MSDLSPAGRVQYPPGFRARRGLNWFIIGLLYGSYYMCRYNFRFATPGMVDEFHFSKTQVTGILSAWSLAYGTGQLVNGLLTDRIGGKTAMLIGAAGTITINLIFGFASFAGTFSTFALIWLLNGYVQSFGAPGMIKINAAWFSRTERGTFAGIFGLMIQSGQFAINNLAPLILAGFTIGAWVVAKGDWHWLFRIPPMIVGVAALLLAIFVKQTPEEAGYPDVIEDETGGKANVIVSLRESFTTIFMHPLVWLYALAYACTGAVRNSSDQLMILYFRDQLKLNLEEKPPAVFWTVNLMPLVAVIGSFSAGIVSDKVFKGHRSPVAMTLYFFEAFVILIAAGVIFSGAVGPTPTGVFIGCLFLVLVAFTANSTHAIVGTAAPMDIGGRRMAGFASGVIDSFQYYGTAIALPLTGWLLDKYGWGVWYPVMAGFGVMGGCAMLLVIRKQRLMAAQGG
ncbi:MAG: transporter, family, glycerol-3-phosphate transporter [Chthoniobacter sp.]|jgi:OPA family glycerol-3-phosphate transporter-like MFS transporter|nr:transporter, family, glycerol-3-phosphate transporter [Chthoniobacter sp.]